MDLKKHDEAILGLLEKARALALEQEARMVRGGLATHNLDVTFIGSAMEAVQTRVRYEESIRLREPKPPQLRTDGPTLAEYVAKGYDAKGYPPTGYTDKRTPKELKAAAEAKAAADAKAEEPKVPAGTPEALS